MVTKVGSPNVRKKRRRALVVDGEVSRRVHDREGYPACRWRPRPEVVPGWRLRQARPARLAGVDELDRTAQAPPPVGGVHDDSGGVQPAGRLPDHVHGREPASASYGFGPFVANTLSVTTTGPCLHPHLRSDPVTVGAGEAVCISPGAKVSGGITVARRRARPRRSPSCRGRSVQRCDRGAHLPGARDRAAVGLGQHGARPRRRRRGHGPVRGHTISRPVDLTNNHGGVEFSGNHVSGSVPTISGTGGGGGGDRLAARDRQHRQWTSQDLIPHKAEARSGRRLSPAPQQRSPGSRVARCSGLPARCVLDVANGQSDSSHSRPRARAECLVARDSSDPRERAWRRGRCRAGVDVDAPDHVATRRIEHRVREPFPLRKSSACRSRSARFSSGVISRGQRPSGYPGVPAMCSIDDVQAS